MDDLRRLASANGGVFSFADASACGFTRSAVRHRVATGQWRRLRRGLMAESALVDDGLPYDEVPNLVRVAAALRAVGTAAAASHHTAAAVLGLATYAAVPSFVAVTSPRQPARSCQSLPWLRVRRSGLPDDQVWTVDGVRVTSPARTAVDIARSSSLRAAVVVLDSALRAGASPDELRRVVRMQARWPGVTRARQALVVADPGSESPLESLAHVCQFEAGLPRPRTQVELFDSDGLVGRVDDCWAEYGVVGESDGLLKYSAVDVLRREKLRQERLERLGLRVVRVTYRDVTTDAARTRARYRAAFPGAHFAERVVVPRASGRRRSDHPVGVVDWVGDGGGRMGA